MKLHDMSIRSICCAFVHFLLISCSSVKASWSLPDGYSMVFDPSSGWELQWKSVDGIKVPVGGSRPEFRLSGNSLLGYPVETLDGGLRLTVTPAQQVKLSTEGKNLEVWSSGKRLDRKVSNNIFRQNITALVDRGYDSKPPNTPTIDVDPAVNGTFAFDRLSYNLLPLRNVTDFPNPIEVLGEVTRPLLASGKRPLVLFLHGRHATCYNPKSKVDVTIDWPCSTGYKPIPSHKGYRYVADILASQGYITVSISANGINGQDGWVYDGGMAARSILIRRHLALWARWNTGQITDPWGGVFQGKVDMNKVVLVGHSRGGEGVNRAAVDTKRSNPYKIVGIVTYGPTAFGRQMTPDVHSITILPTCDGDVSDLQGQAYVDDSRDIAWSEALRSAVVSIGTNHNFYNTEWTPGLSEAPSNDDWYEFDGETVCSVNSTGSVRLSPKEQQIVGAAYTCALVRLAVNQDPLMLPFLDGSFVKPKSIGRAEIAVNAVGGAGYRLLFRPYDNSNKTATLSNGMNGNACAGSTYYSSDDTLKPCYNDYFASSPHWLPRYIFNEYPASRAFDLRWNNRLGATAVFNIVPTNLTGLNSIDLRLANDPNRSPAMFELWIRDNTGKNSTLRTNLTSIDGWPGTGSLDRIHAHTFRGDIKSAGKQVNLNQIVAIILVARSASGRVWVLDIATSQARTVQPLVLDLPVLSVPQTYNLTEGFGPQRSNITITADKPFTSPAAVWVEQFGKSGYRLDIPVGSANINLPFTWIGDKVYNPSIDFNYVVIGTISGVKTGNYIGGATIIDDDPMPVLSAVNRNVVGVEGGSLVWNLRLSSPSSGISYYFKAVKPTSGKELSTADVDKKWLESTWFSGVPSKPVSLSKASIYIEARFPYGVTSIQLVIPLSYDGVAEGDEKVRLEILSFEDPTVPTKSNLVLFGTVKAHT